MALETLKDVKEIDGFDVNNYDKTMDIKEYLELGTKPFIEIHHRYNRILFKIQDGPIKENGINGCQVDTLIEAAKLILEGLNKQFPCYENSMAITGLDDSLKWLYERKKNREKRGVEFI